MRSVLSLVKSGDPYTIDQKTQDAAARNPRWVPEISSATAASTGAHVGTHAAAEAARVIFRFGLWPAALELWRIGPKDSRAAQWQTARWKDGQLTAPGLFPLALSDVAARAHAKNGITGAMAHGFNRWAWSQADFKIDGQNWTADIDALALRRGAGKFVRLDRTSVKFPPTDFPRIGTTYTAQCGTLARVEINRSSGALRIAKAECGTALVPEERYLVQQGSEECGDASRSQSRAPRRHPDRRRNATGRRGFSACRFGRSAGKSREHCQLRRNRRYGGALRSFVHRGRQSADPSALYELPSRRRSPASGRRPAFASAAGRARRRRLWTSGDALPDLPPNGQFRTRRSAGQSRLASGAA
jgi:hypothetical protein